MKSLETSCLPCPALRYCFELDEQIAAAEKAQGQAATITEEQPTGIRRLIREQAQRLPAFEAERRRFPIDKMLDHCDSGIDISEQDGAIVASCQSGAINEDQRLKTALPIDSM